VQVQVVGAGANVSIRKRLKDGSLYSYYAIVEPGQVSICFKNKDLNPRDSGIWGPFVSKQESSRLMRHFWGSHILARAF